MSLYEKENSQYLEECFQSLFNQTLAAPEIILVYDGVIPDELQIVVQRWQERLPIAIIPLEQNVGLGMALNHGLKHCSHDIVLRMDTDDIARPDRFKQQIDFFRQNPNVAVLGGQIQEFETSPQEPTGIRAVPTTHDEIVRYAVKKCPFNHMTVGYKKGAILAIGSYQHFPFMEDYHLWLRVIAQGYQVSNLPGILVDARAGRNMLLRRRGLTMAKREWALAKLKINLKLQNIPMAYLYFILRAGARLLPVSLLRLVYANNRSS